MFTTRSLFGPLWEGAPAKRVGERALDLSKTLSLGMALSLLLRGTSLAEGGFKHSPAGFYFIVEIFAEIGYTIL